MTIQERLNSHDIIAGLVNQHSATLREILADRNSLAEKLAAAEKKIAELEKPSAPESP